MQELNNMLRVEVTPAQIGLSYLLAFALEDAPENAALLAAEDAVLDACAGLNDIAVRRQRGEGIRPLRDARTARAVPECEADAVR